MRITQSRGLRDRIAAAMQEIDHLFPDRDERLRTAHEVTSMFDDTLWATDSRSLRIAIGDAIMPQGLEHQDEICEYITDRILDYLTDPQIHATVFGGR